LNAILNLESPAPLFFSLSIASFQFRNSGMEAQEKQGERGSWPTCED
jgi:hypothetical protein